VTTILDRQLFPGQVPTKLVSPSINTLVQWICPNAPALIAEVQSHPCADSKRWSLE
jgi:hypothetical protein